MLLAGEIEYFVSASGQIPDNPPVRQQILGKFPYTIIMRSGHALISGRAERARYPLLISSRDKALAALPEALQHLASGIVHSAETFTALSKLLQRSDALWPTSPYAVLDELEAGTLVEYLDGQGEKGAIPVQIPIVIYSLERRSQSALALEMQRTMRGCIGRLAERYQSSRLSR